MDIDVKQVCFIRLGAIGDLFVATAALEEILQRFPKAHVWVAGHPFWMQVLIPSKWTRVNGVIPLESKTTLGQLHLPDLKNETWVPVGEPKFLYQHLKRCQASVNLRYQSLRYAWPSLRAGVPIRLGSCPWPYKWVYTHWAPYLGKDPIIHERDQLLRISRAEPVKIWPLGLTSRNRKSLNRNKNLVLQPGPDFARGLPQLKTPDSQKASELTGISAKTYVLVNPTASRREKAWPPQKYRELCQRLLPHLKRRGFELLVIGAPHESEWLHEVAAQDLRVVQPANIRELMDVVGCARALITNASSLQFCANALRTPTMTLMGRTFPARWGPLSSQDLVVCGKIPNSKVTDVFAEDFATYNSIEVSTVENEFLNWFENQTVEHSLAKQNPAPS